MNRSPRDFDSFRFDAPPIIEAVIDIDCDPPIGQDLSSLEGRGKGVLAEEYPVFKRRIMRQHQIAVDPSVEVPVATRSELIALQFFRPDEKQIVQIRADGYSFNRLAPYAGFDDYIGEIRRTWEAYVSIAEPRSVRKVRLRYINRILLPEADRGVDLRTYLQVGPQVPDRENFILTGFVDQHTAVERTTGNVINTVLAGQPPENGHVPVIFDNGVEAELVTNPADWQSIEAKLLDLRRLKNRIFVLTLTQSCLNLFQRS